MTESRTRGRRLRVPWVALAVLLAALLTGAVLVVLYARGGGPVPDALGFLRPRATDPLGPSSSAETTLRTLRLAGFDQAVVGDRGGTIVVRVVLPETRSPAQVELSWQTAFVAAAYAYPRAGRVVAQLFAPDGSPLMEVSADARVVRTATERDDAASLRGAARFTYLPSAGGSR